MKQTKKIAVLLLLITLMLTTGCTHSFRDEDTKKTYTENILCKPTDEEAIKAYNKNYLKDEKENTILYEDKMTLENLRTKLNKTEEEILNKVSELTLELNLESVLTIEDTKKITESFGYTLKETTPLEDLPDCSDLKITSGGYEGLWTNIFVKPLAWLIVKVGLILKNYGYSIILLGILLRLLVLPLTKQTLDMSENMKKANPELQRLEKKYANRTDQESMLRKNQEMLMIYKKYNIKPFSGCLVSLIQLPLFFAFLEAIQRIPAILEETTFGLDLGTTPWTQITSGNYYYIIIVILIALSTYYSFKNTTSANINEEAAAQTKMMTKFMVVFITIMSFSLNVGIALYWFATNAFAILQNYLLKRLRNRKENK